jgi:hypothetical protein
MKKREVVEATKNVDFKPKPGAGVRSDQDGDAKDQDGDAKDQDGDAKDCPRDDAAASKYVDEDLPF